LVGIFGIFLLNEFKSLHNYKVKMNVCEKCNKSYSTRFNLNKHLKKCQEENSKPFKCECSKEYSSEKYFFEHKSKCSYLMLKEMKENIETIKNEQQRAKETANNININNYIQANFIIKGNMVYPLDLSQSRFDRIADKNYTYQVYDKNSVVRDVIIPYLSTDDGKPSAVITDKSRMTIKCVDINNKVVTHDPNTIVNLCTSSKPLIEKHFEYKKKYTSDVWGNPISYNDSESMKKDDRIKVSNYMKQALYNNSHRLLQKKPKEVEPIRQDYIEATIKFIEE
jgi:hypothetical protein